MSRTKTIINKELKRVFWDKKLIMSLYVFPAVILIVVFGLMGQLISSMESDIVEHVSSVTIVNATDELKSVIEATGYDETADITYITEEEYRVQSEELNSDIYEGNSDLVVYLPDDFEESVADYENSETPEIGVYYNGTENYSAQAYTVFAQTVEAGYEEELLNERFGSMNVLKAFTVQPVQIYKEEKANTQFVSMMLPYLIVMMLFAGVMSIGVDAIAGEKERGTLSSMLISPAKRSEIVVGKLVSMAILSGISALCYAVTMILAMSLMGSASGLAEMGFGGVSLNVLQVIELIVSMLVIVYLYVGIVGLLATLAKDTKAASSMISPCYIVVVLLGVMTMFSTGETVPTYRYLIPVYGNAIAIKDICSNELTGINFMCSLAGTLALGIIFTAAITKAFNSEKIMFNA